MRLRQFCLINTLVYYSLVRHGSLLTYALLIVMLNCFIFKIPVSIHRERSYGKPTNEEPRS